jgi:hypothetical protein
VLNITKTRAVRLITAVFLLLCATTVLGQPSITSFSPAYGSPGEEITIHGTGFYPGTVTVRFNGTTSVGATATTPIMIKAPVPSGATTGPISVKVGSSAFVESAKDFTVIGAGPYVTGFSPTNGSGGIGVTIFGAHFTGATAVKFAGKSATYFHVIGDTSIIATNPPGVESGPITVTSAKGSHTSAGNFHVPPVVKSFSPSSGRTGTNIIVLGTNFLDTVSVRLGTMYPAFTVLSNRALRVTVPELARTADHLRVETPIGSSTLSNVFKVLPTISDFSPRGGPPGTLVQITGANLNIGTPAVTFGGLPALYGDLTFGSMTAIVPAGATTGPLAISTGDGSHSAAVPFYVTPTITTFTPVKGPPGTMVTITGSNFTGATNVAFGGLPAASFEIVNNSTITAVAPLGKSNGQIRISTPGGIAFSSGLFYDAPEIWNFSPTHGLPGTNVTVFGANLLGATAVYFNGINGVAGTSLIATNNGFLTVTVPEQAQAGPLTVVTPGGTNTSAGFFVLDYADLALSIKTDSPYLFSGSNFVLTLAVTNLGPANAPNAFLTNTILAGVELLSARTSQGTVRTNPLPVWADIGNLAAGAGAEVNLGLVYRGTGTVYITGGTRSDFVDLQPTNNVATYTATVLPPPVLSIKWWTNQVRVAWPLMLSNFTLQYRTGLSSTNIWAPVTKMKTNDAAENLLIETNAGNTRLYRLQSPDAP